MNLLRQRPVIVFEAGEKSTGQYGVTPAEMYELLDGELGYDLSTMARWLEGVAPMSSDEFAANWNVGSEWVFLATPRAVE